MHPYTNLTYTISDAYASAGISPSLIPGLVAGTLAGLGLLLVWTLIWKGFALWYASRNNQIGWFIALLIFNTGGLLEIFYLIFWRKNKNNQIHTTITTHTVTASTPAPDTTPVTSADTTPLT